MINSLTSRVRANSGLIASIWLAIVCSLACCSEETLA